MSTVPQIFNRELLLKKKNRAAPVFAEHNFLFEIDQENMISKLEDSSKLFPSVLVIGYMNNNLSQYLRDVKGAKHLVNMDITDRMQNLEADEFICADIENLPDLDRKFDLVLASLCLHNINDLPGFLVRIKNFLNEGGLFIGSMFGGETLIELKKSLFDAENEILGGPRPHIAPFADVKSLGALLMRAKFTMPVADSELITASYPNILRLFNDLRGMGETNILVNSAKTGLSRVLLAKIEEVYRREFVLEDGTLEANFEIINLTGVA